MHIGLNILLCIVVVAAASRSPRFLMTAIVAATVMVALRYINSSSVDTYATLGLIKQLLLVPLGLGAITAFPLLAPERQRRWHGAFNAYVNVAILANIGAMLVVPAEATWRGWVAKVDTLLLLLWLAQEMRGVRWRTVSYSGPIMLFSAAPLPWILCHALYRASLMSLPVFRGGAYWAMEFLSLAAMLALKWQRRGYQPVSHYFGAADTCVVATMAVTYGLMEREPLCPEGGWLAVALANLQGSALCAGTDIEVYLDRVFIPLQVGVAAIAATYVIRGARSKGPA